MSECELQWPTVKIADRCIFQHGALGGATADEFHCGNPRVEDYLRRRGSHRRRWDSPSTNSVTPEAEWGFEQSLREDVERLADFAPGSARGARVAPNL